MVVDLIVLVRRPPGRSYLHRVSGDRLTVGRAPECDLQLDDGEVSPLELEFVREDERAFAVLNRRAAALFVGEAALPPGARRRLASADALVVGPFVIEVAFDRGDGPTTDRRARARLARMLDAEQRVQRAGGPALWVLRGAQAGLARSIAGPEGLRCGADPGCDLHLPDAGVERDHFTLRPQPDGRVALSASAPVVVRGVPTTEASLGSGDLIFVGAVVAEVRLHPYPARDEPTSTDASAAVTSSTIAAASAMHPSEMGWGARGDERAGRASGRRRSARASGWIGSRPARWLLASPRPGWGTDAAIVALCALSLAALGGAWWFGLGG